MAINSVDDIASGLANSKQHKTVVKILTAAKAVGAFQSGWMGTGTPSAGVASPTYTSGSGYTCSSATTGALPFTNGSVQLWLARALMSCTQPGTVVRASTAVTPTTSNYTLNLSVGDNTLIDTTTTDETHIITMTWTYGTNKQGTEDYRYTIKNLQYIT